MPRRKIAAPPEYTGMVNNGPSTFTSFGGNKSTSIGNHLNESGTQSRPPKDEAVPVHFPDLVTSNHGSQESLRRMDEL